MSNETPVMDHCRVCGGSPITFLCHVPNEHSGTTLLSNYRCSVCGSVFVGNVVSDEELGEAYGTLSTKDYYREIENENRSKMVTALEHLKGEIDADAAILDIGTGNGLFIKTLHEAGFTNLYGHEIPGADISMIESIVKQQYADFDYASVPDETFDVVTLLDVAEHVQDPRQLFATCFRMLKPGGLCYFHTPVVTRTDRMFHLIQKLPAVGKIGRVWQRGRTSIFHLENYTSKAFHTILQGAGFSDVKVRVVNELSWPVSRYVRIYLLEKQGLPKALGPVITPLFYPILATNLFNANKGMVWARKAK